MISNTWYNNTLKKLYTIIIILHNWEPHDNDFLPVLYVLKSL